MLRFLEGGGFSCTLLFYRVRQIVYDINTCRIKKSRFCCMKSSFRSTSVVWFSAEKQTIHMTNERPWVLFEKSTRMLDRTLAGFETCYTDRGAFIVLIGVCGATYTYKCNYSLDGNEEDIQASLAILAPLFVYSCPTRAIMQGS